MRLGTHNSLSYLKPAQWWLRPFSWMGRCQRLTYQQQYHMGVRYFDIRVRFIKNRHIFDAVSGHGLLTYGMRAADALAWLDEASTADDTVTVRLFWENERRHPKRGVEKWQLFISYCQRAFANLRLVGGACRYEYHEFIGHEPPLRVCYAEYYKKKFRVPFPLLWAKRHNKELKEKYAATGELCVFDFVDA